MKLDIPTSIACLEANGDDHHQEETLLQAADQDVLFGRGGKSYSHPGNRLFRRLIFHHKDLYESMKKPNHRQFLALSIVEAMRRSGARFLRKESSPSGEEVWKTVGAKEACIKTSQALRDANVRTKKCNKAQRKDGGASTNAVVVPNQARNERQADRHVVSPCNSAPSSKDIETSLPSVPSLKTNAAAAASSSEDLEGIDHIDLETIHTLVRSLGENRQQQLQQESTSHGSSSRRQAFQRSSLGRWSLTRPPLQTQLQQQPMHTPSRQSLLVRDWLSKEAATPDIELPPNALKPSTQPHRQEFSSTTRCSISSVSMLEAGLFNADFEFDDFDIDTETFAA